MEEGDGEREREKLFGLDCTEQPKRGDGTSVPRVVPPFDEGNSEYVHIYMCVQRGIYVYEIGETAIVRVKANIGSSASPLHNSDTGLTRRVTSFSSRISGQLYTQTISYSPFVSKRSSCTHVYLFDVPGEAMTNNTGKSVAKFSFCTAQSREPAK